MEASYSLVQGGGQPAWSPGYGRAQWWNGVIHMQDDCEKDINILVSKSSFSLKSEEFFCSEVLITQSTVIKALN